MTQINRVAVTVILARKHWDAIIGILEPYYQSRGDDWLQWGKYVKQAMQANSQNGASPEDLALVTLAEDNWITINGILEGNCRTRSHEWVVWAANIIQKIQAAIENAKMTPRPEEVLQKTDKAGESLSSNETKPVLETTPYPGIETIGQFIADLRDNEQREAATQALIKIGEPVVEPLLASLKVEDKFETKLAVREILSQMGSLAVNSLLAAFETNEVIDVPRIAAEALGKIGDARAVEPLIIQFLKAEGLTTFNPVIHDKAQFAARALANIGDERAIAPLIQILEDSRNHEIIRGSAIQALGELKAAKAVGLLISIFNQGKPNLSRQAAQALGKIGGSQIVEILISALRNPKVDIRVNAAVGLKSAADLRGVEPLISALKDPYWLVRNEAIRSLGALGDKRAVGPIIALLDDPMFDVKWSAAMELGGFRDDRALPKLILALHDPEVVIRRSAAKSLGQIGDPRAVEALITALASPVETDILNSSQEVAAEALGLIGDTRASASLANALKHSNQRVQEKAAKALERIGTPEALSAITEQPTG
jgi:HEAT repeat protein